MRAALLPTPGDPFMLAYWLRNFETWHQEVDELIVYVNGQRDPEAVAYDRRIIEEHGGRMLYSPDTVGHDGALLGLLLETSAEYVVLCEDDAYVRKPIMVGVSFVGIEDGKYDIVGSPRHEDYAGQTMEWGPYTPGALDELRHGLWPAFLFARRNDLLATDRIFGDRAWPRGGNIPGWGYVGPAACDYIGIAAEFVHLDTFFGTTFQLRAAGLRTHLVHHVRLYDPKATEDWLAEDPPWFHVTGLSTLPPVLDGTDPATLPDMDAHGGLWTRRMAWWELVTQRGADVPGMAERWRILADFRRRSGMRAEDDEAWLLRFLKWEPRAMVPA
jgi:hypothetical protein